MKTFLLTALVGATLATASLEIFAADDTSTTAPTTGADGTTGTQGEKGERWRAAFAQLSLTDEQKTRIQQIRASVTDRKERRQQIMGVLTPDQKTKLKELIRQSRSNAQTSGTTTAAP
jgi:Spy/CpxP family protein refolding chaperone